MNILMLEPYYTGSHAAWIDGYVEHSQHTVKTLTLKGNFWKWRMHGGAVTLARKFSEAEFTPDLLLTSDMLDLTTFLALTREKTAHIPTAIYFHENQLSYPWSPTDRDVAQKRDKHYGFINYVSALAADAVSFNSHYHMQSFLDELPRLLKHFPDHNELGSVKQVTAKSSVLPLGLNLKRFDAYAPAAKNQSRPPLIIWNHRWEYDKGPEEFFEAVYILAEHGLEFEVAILGESFSQKPEAFLTAKEILGQRIVQYGYAQDFSTYAKWLWQADLIPITSNQDFFGASLMQALYCNCTPLLPKRLTYPELVPINHYSEFFYNDFDDLVNKLGVAIREIKTVRQQSFRSIAAQYDWSTMAPQYDDWFQAML